MSKREWLKHLGFTTATAIATRKKANMTDEDYKQLERLLGLLANEVKGKICVIPHYLHDGFHVGLFNNKTGEPIVSATAATLKEAIIQLNNPTPDAKEQDDK